MPQESIGRLGLIRRSARLALILLLLLPLRAACDMGSTLQEAAGQAEGARSRRHHRAQAADARPGRATATRTPRSRATAQYAAAATPRTPARSHPTPQPPRPPRARGQRVAHDLLPGSAQAGL